jgi:hypothetical protein
MGRASSAELKPDRWAVSDDAEEKPKKIAALLSGSVEVKSVPDTLEEKLKKELAALIKEYPAGKTIDINAQEAIDLFEKRGKLDPPEGAPNERPKISLSGASEETFEVLLGSGLITQEMADQKEAGLEGAIFLRLYRDAETKIMLTTNQAVQIIRVKSDLYFENRSKAKTE